MTRNSRAPRSSNLKSVVKRRSAKAKGNKEVGTKKTTRQCACEHHDDHEALDEQESIKPLNDGVDVNSDTTELDQKIVFVDRPSDLKKIKNDAVQLAVWRRNAAETTEQKYVNPLLDPSVAASDLPTFEGLVTPDDAAMAMRAYLCPPYKLRSKMKKLPNYDDAIGSLIDEIDQLVRVFADISQSEFVHVKLHVVHDHGCAYWHQDCVEYRLVKTYRGPCTEWVPPAYSETTLGRYKFNSKHARSFTHRDVALFKGRGETLEEDEFLHQPGIVHRSPRIEEGCGMFRLVLVLDVPMAGWHF